MCKVAYPPLGGCELHTFCPDSGNGVYNVCKFSAGSLRALNAPREIRDALAPLPPAFAEAFAAEAVRLVEAGRVPVKPADGAPLPVPFSPRALAWMKPAQRAVLTMGDAPGVPNWKIEPLAVARWRVLDALLRFRAGRLAAFCRGFWIVRAAWEEANGRRLVPAGADWPPLPSREFTSTENPATPPAAALAEEAGRTK